MKSENEIIKLVDNSEITKRYYVIKDIENSSFESNLKAYKNLVFLAENIKNLYSLSDQESFEVDRLSYNLSYNFLKYYGYKIIGIVEEDKNLEKIIKLLNNFNYFEKKYLNLIKDKLKSNVSDPYLLLYLMIKYKDKLLKYYNNQLLIFESNCKGFNAFTDQEDIENLSENTDKVIKLVKEQKN